MESASPQSTSARSGHIIDRNLRRRLIVVDNRALAQPIGDRRVAGVEEVDIENLVGS